MVESDLVQRDQHLDAGMGPVGEPGEDRERKPVLDVEHHRVVVVVRHRHHARLLTDDGDREERRQFGVPQGVDRHRRAPFVLELAEHPVVGAAQHLELGPMGVQPEHEVRDPAGDPGHDVEQPRPPGQEDLHLDDLDRADAVARAAPGQPGRHERHEGLPPPLVEIEHGPDHAMSSSGGSSTSSNHR